MKLSNQYVRERMGDETTETEADSMISELENIDITTEEQLDAMDDGEFFDTMDVALNTEG